jgi:hypothetical protein
MTELGIGSPLNPATATSANHWASLKREEDERRKAEVSRMMLGSPNLPPAGDALSGLVELLRDPKQTSKRISDLAEATKKNNESAAAAQKATEKAKQAEQSLAAAKKAHDAEIERRDAELDEKARRQEAAFDVERKEIAKLKAAAEADFAAAAKAKSIAERRLKAMESVS